MSKIAYRFAPFSVVAGVLFVAGCTPQSVPPPVAAPASPAATAHGHDHPHSGHGAGPHEGTVADWGGGTYHVEFTVDHDKKEATVYVLGGDEKTPAPIKAADGKLLLTITQPAFQVDLLASPLEGEVDGMCSRFVGQHDNLGVVQELAGTISGEAGGTPYAGDFQEEPHGPHDQN